MMSTNSIDTRPIQIARLLESLVHNCQSYLSDGGEPVEIPLGKSTLVLCSKPFQLSGKHQPFISDEYLTENIEELSVALPRKLRLNLLATLDEFGRYLSDALTLAQGNMTNSRAKNESICDDIFSKAIAEAHSVCGERLLRLASRATAWWQVRKVGKPSDKITFIPTVLQKQILKSLENKALKKQPLADAVCGSDGGRLYKPGGIKELIEAGKVQHKHGVGYYRPDAPPA